jgi:hypothetical protein
VAGLGVGFGRRDPDATELTHLPKIGTKRQIIGDFPQDVCLICGHQEEAATSPWHHFASKPVKEA